MQHRTPVLKTTTPPTPAPIPPDIAVTGARGRRRWRITRYGILWGIVLLGGLAALASVLLMVVLVAYGSQDRARKADVIVMLSGSPALTERRTRHAIELYHQGYAPILICSGGQKWKISEAERCARRAIRNGVPADAIYLDDQSYSTGDNAANVKAIMDAHGWKTAVMVTDNYHIWRAEWVFKREGVTVYSSPAQTTQPTQRMDIAKNSVREFAAISWHVSRSVVGLGY